MARKVNQFAQVIADVRREISEGRAVAAKANVETVQTSLSRIDPKNDPLKMAIKASGIRMRPERDRRR